MIGGPAHPLHCESVAIEIQLMILCDLNVAHITIEVLALRGWLSARPGFNTSPQHTLTNFWRTLPADVRERSEATRHPLVDLHTSCCSWWWNLWRCWRVVAPFGAQKHCWATEDQAGDLLALPNWVGQ